MRLWHFCIWPNYFPTPGGRGIEQQTGTGGVDLCAFWGERGGGGRCQVVSLLAGITLTQLATMCTVCTV